MTPIMYVSFGFVFGWLGSRIADLIVLLVHKRKKKKKEQFVYDEDKDVIEDQEKFS